MMGYELYELLQKHWYVRSIFRGVYASDNLPVLMSGVPHAFILNLDKQNQPGTHWCAIFISPHGHLTYFDSFGLPPLVPSIQNFIRKNSLTFNYNRLIIQDVFSTTCGLYAVYFIERVCRGDHLNGILSVFKTYSTFYNDKMIIKLYRTRLIKLSHISFYTEQLLNKV